MSDVIIKTLPQLKQFVFFSIGGVLTVAIDLFITWLLISFDKEYLFSISIGFFSGLIFNYIYHSKITFNIKYSKQSALKYSIIVALNYFLMIAIIASLHNFFGISPLNAKIISIPIITIHGFLWSKLWIFNSI